MSTYKSTLKGFQGFLSVLPGSTGSRYASGKCKLENFLSHINQSVGTCSSEAPHLGGEDRYLLVQEIQAV